MDITKINVPITEQMFTDLISGKVIQVAKMDKTVVNIALNDIGYERMINIVREVALRQIATDIKKEMGYT